MRWWVKYFEMCDGDLVKVGVYLIELRGVVLFWFVEMNKEL